jgi:hypothetical protein
MQIEIALRAGQVAKYALEFTDTSVTPLLLKLRYKHLAEEMNGLREAVAKAAAE